MIGTSIRGYKFIDEIGSGGFSDIYKVVKNKQIYAIKVIEKEMIEEQGIEKYIMNEVMILQKIDSPHVVKLHEFLQDQDYYYFVLECCESNTLLEYIIEERPIFETCVKILIQIMEGLKQVHSIKCLHRDIKLENILKKNQTFKIADFGLSAQSTEGQSYIGTLKYMAPEILNDHQGHNYKADYWSLGVIFFFMLFRCFPFVNRKNLYNEQKKKSLPFYDLKKELRRLGYLYQQHEINKINQDICDFFKMVFTFDPKLRCPTRQFFSLKLFQPYMDNNSLQAFIKVYEELEKKEKLNPIKKDQGKKVQQKQETKNTSSMEQTIPDQMKEVLESDSQGESKKQANFQQEEEKIKQYKLQKQQEQQQQENEKNVQQSNENLDFEQKNQNKSKKQIRKYFINIQGQIKAEDDFEKYELDLADYQTVQQQQQQLKQLESQQDKNKRVGDELDSINQLFQNQKDNLFEDTEDLVKKIKQQESSQKNKMIFGKNSRCDMKSDSFYQERYTQMSSQSDNIKQQISIYHYEENDEENDKENQKDEQKSNLNIQQISNQLNQPKKEVIYNVGQNLSKRVSLSDSQKFNNRGSQCMKGSNNNTRTSVKFKNQIQKKDRVSDQENISSEADEITPCSMSYKIEALLINQAKYDNQEYFGPCFNVSDLYIIKGDNDTSPQITRSRFTETIRSARSQKIEKLSKQQTLQTMKSTLFKQNVRDGIFDMIFFPNTTDFMKTYIFQMKKYLFLTDCINMIQKITVTPHTFSILVCFVVKTIVYQINQILEPLLRKENAYQIERELFEDFLLTKNYTNLIKKLQVDLLKWKKKQLHVISVINMSVLPKNIKNSLEIELFPDNYNSYFKNQIRSVICPIYKASYKIAQDANSAAKTQMILRGTLYLLQFIMINHVNKKIPNHFFGNFQNEDQYDFEFYVLWVQSLDSSQLMDQIQIVTKQTFGQGALDYLLK